MSDSPLPFSTRSSAFQPAASPQSDQATDADHELLMAMGISADDAKNVAMGGVTREDTMTTEDAARIFEACIADWRITDNQTKVLVLNSLLYYLCLNAPSPRANYSGYLEVKGMKYPMSVFNDHVGGRPRQFHRVFVESGRVTKILKGSPQKALELARKYGLPDRLGIYAYDTADRCPDIPAQVRAELATFKRLKLETTSAYIEIDPTRVSKVGPRESGRSDTSHEFGSSSRGAAY